MFAVYSPGGGGGEGGARRTCKMHLNRGVWGTLTQKNFWTLHALTLNLEQSGGIWNQAHASVKLNNLLVLQQRTLSRVHWLFDSALWYFRDERTCRSERATTYVRMAIASSCFSWASLCLYMAFRTNAKFFYMAINAFLIWYHRSSLEGQGSSNAYSGGIVPPCPPPPICMAAMLQVKCDSSNSPAVLSSSNYSNMSVL